MAELIEIAQADDPLLADYRNLRDVELRTHLEAEHGLFLAEGEKVVRRAVEAGYTPRSFLMAARWLDGLADILDQTDAPCYVVSEALAERVTGFHVHRGALASMRREPLPPLESVVRHARRVAVLEDLVDHANVGAAFRSALALGVDAVLLSPRCADPLYRRAVKVSMGAVLQIPWSRVETWPGGLTELRRRGFSVVALTISDDAIELDDLVRRRLPRLALVFGTEGHGITEEACSLADLRVRIPMSGGADSLNVAAATAVVFYATR